MPFRLINQVTNAAANEVSQALRSQKQPPSDPTPVDTYREQVRVAQAKLNSQQQQLLSSERQIEALQGELAQARALGQAQQIAELEQRLARTLAGRKQRVAQKVDMVTRLEASQKQLIEHQGTASAFAELGQKVPIVLLPVRLETRYFAADADHYELRVRIYPDEIHIDDHQSLMSAGEAEMGQQYWQVRLAEGDESEGAIAAWGYLCQQVGEDRAFQIVSQLDPAGFGRREATNRETSADSQTTNDLLPVPKEMIAPDSWGDTPHARALPDRWAIAGYRENRRVLLHWGKPIPPELPVSPDFNTPVADDDDTVEPDDGIRWMTDFETAEAVGMAARIRVNKTIARSMDRLLVFGIDASQTPEESTFELDRLLRAHTHTGLNLALPGSPTNNTRRAKTGYRKQSANHRASHQRLLAGNGAPVPETSHAARLASAFGLNPSAFRFLKHGLLDGEKDIQAMFQALWPVSWGDFLKYQIEIPVPGSATQFLQKHYKQYVRPRGLFPALQVEAQPYGILPIVSLKRWASSAGNNRLMEARLAKGLQSLLNLWLHEPERIPRLFGNEEAPHVYTDPQRSLLKILSMSPTTEVSSGQFLEYATANSSAQARSRMQTWWNTAILTLGHSLLNLKTPLLNIRLSDRKTGLRQRNFTTTNNPLVSSQADKTQPLTENYIAAFAAHPSISQVRNHQIPGATERSVLYVMLRSAFLETETSRDYNYTDFFNSLNALKDLPVESLEALVTDVIDGASHRLDAWISSLANRRLAEIRSERINTVHIGGYGWVEGLEPPGEGMTDSQPPEEAIEEDIAEDIAEDIKSAGYLHMPSPAQAKTAAILYGANQAQAEQVNRSSIYAIDLSSEKVRRGKWLLDGLKQSQPLGALLGYWLERRLIERNLSALIAPMRALAPLKVGDIPTQTLATSHVMDGLTIYGRWKDGSLRQRLGSDYNGRLLQILGELDSSKDALSDLLLAEGVHQATNGNPVRAAAAFDALADGSSRLDAPEVTATPVTGQQLEHRVVVMLPEGLPEQGSGAWPKDAQQIRAIAEPRLNAWAMALLGSPDEIHFTATFLGTAEAEPTVEVRDYTLADFDLCALDVVHLAGSKNNTPPLLELLRLFLLKTEGLSVDGSLAAETVTIQPQPGVTEGRSLAEALAIAQNLMRVLTAARPLQPGDLSANSQSLANSQSAQSSELTSELNNRAQATQTAFSQIREQLTQQPDQANAWWQAALLLGPVDPNLADGLPSMATALSQRQATADEQTEPQAPLKQIQALLGKDFKAIALFSPNNPGELDANFSHQSTLLEGDMLRPKRWLQDYGRVRPGVEALDLSLTLGELFAAPTQLQVAQFPYQADQSWVGEQRPKPTSSGQSLPQHSVVAHTPFPLSTKQPITGLVVDSWSEALPQDKTVTGVAFHYDEPKAQAPQSILLAMPPDTSRGWEFEDLESALLETFDLIKLRGITVPPHRDLGAYLPALTTLDDLRSQV